MERLADVAGDGGRLAAVVRPPVVTAGVARATGRAETVEPSVEVPRPGRYGIWLGGSFRDGLEARVDGRVIGTHRHRLDTEGGYTLLGEAELDPRLAHGDAALLRARPPSWLERRGLPASARSCCPDGGWRTRR